MTTTPTVWKAEFTANAGITAGSQLAPVTIGLADDRILTIWVDDANNVDDDPGTDIIGQIYDAQANVVGGAFQLNQDFFTDSENDPDIAALPDGGFVVVFEDVGTGASGDAAIRFERYNSAGTQTFGGTIVSGTFGGVRNSDPSIAVLANGDFVVSYQKFGGTILARVVNGATNAVGAALNAAQNNGVDAFQDTIVLSNANILTAYQEQDDGVYGIVARIITTAGTNVSVVQIAATGADPLAAGLAGGGFVVVWEDAAAGGNIRAEIRDNTGAVVKANFLVAGGANYQNEPEVVALKDGGFFVIWDDDTANLLRGLRFDGNGAVVGATFTIANGGNTSEPELGLADDGRILVTFKNTGEISQVILDPRDSVINGDSAAETITSRIDGATVNGNGGKDTLLGQGGIDRLFGGAGADVLKGGDDDDLLVGGLAKDTVDGGGGNDRIRVLDGEFGDNSTGGSGIDLLDLSYVSSYGASVDLNAGTWNFTPSLGGPYTIGGVENVTSTALADTIIGNGLDNVIFGQGGKDTLTGNGGADTLDGGLSADTMVGGLGNDKYFVHNVGDVVDETGGDGIDLVTSTVNFNLDSANALGDVEKLTLTGNTATTGLGNALDNTITGNGADNTLHGGGGADTLIGGVGKDTLSGNDAADALLGSVGQDTLTGGQGNDKFWFDTTPNAANADTITDFAQVVGSNNDFFMLDDVAYTTLGAPGGMNPNFFFAGAAANDADDHIVYNQASGQLLYDTNGNGAGGVSLIATLSNKPTLTAADFVVI
jgi:Ca2+-binding RTX toxin-like protein